MIYREKGEGYYCAIITDAQLPEISGYELALEIRKEEKRDISAYNSPVKNPLYRRFRIFGGNGNNNAYQ